MLNQRGKKILTPILRQWMCPSFLGQCLASECCWKQQGFQPLLDHLKILRFLQPYSLPTLVFWMEPNRSYIYKTDYLSHIYHIF